MKMPHSYTIPDPDRTRRLAEKTLSYPSAIALNHWYNKAKAELPRGAEVSVFRLASDANLHEIIYEAAEMHGMVHTTDIETITAAHIVVSHVLSCDRDCHDAPGSPFVVTFVES